MLVESTDTKTIFCVSLAAGFHYVEHVWLRGVCGRFRGVTDR